MKFNCGPSLQARREAARLHWCKWSKWFAWYPVRVGENDCRWLEYVERKASSVYPGFIFEFTPYDFKYRALPTDA